METEDQNGRKPFGRVSRREGEAWIYIDKNNLEIGKPNPAGYLNRIIMVAKKLKFPAEYLKHIESFK